MTHAHHKITRADYTSTRQNQNKNKIKTAGLWEIRICMWQCNGESSTALLRQFGEYSVAEGQPDGQTDQQKD